jgi:hypothetical protein
MKSKSLSLKKTTALSKKADVPLKRFNSNFFWDLKSGDVIICVPPRGKYFYIVTTSLSTITRIICRLGGPNNVSGATSYTQAGMKVRTYCVTVERKFKQPESRILSGSTRQTKLRNRWSDDEWVRYLKCVGRSEGSYKICTTTFYRKLRSTAQASKKYWEFVERAGLNNPPSS